MVNYYAGNNCIDTIARKSSSSFLTNVFYFFLLYVSFLKYFLRLLLPHSRIELLTSALPRFCVRMTILLAFAYFTYKNGALPTELMGLLVSYLLLPTLFTTIVFLSDYL